MRRAEIIDLGRDRHQTSASNRSALVLHAAGTKMQESFGSYTGLYIVLLTLTTTVILLRTYVRVRITKIWQLQDWMLVLAQCGLIATLVLCSAIVQIHERPGETFRQSQDAIIKVGLV